jgi:sarcosine oxidase
VKTVIVGVGVMGAATAWALARRGHDVVMVEQFNVGHSRGSSHGTARYRQLAAYPTVEYLELGLRARRLWDEVEKDSNNRILHRTANISIGDGELLEQQAAALNDFGAPGDLISGSDANEIWPSLTLPSGDPVLVQSDGEVIAANRALSAFVDLARDAGAQLIEDCKVDSVEGRSASAVVRTADDGLIADAVVVTPGPWVNQVARALGLDLGTSVSRQTVIYFEPLDFIPPTITDFGGREPYALWDPANGVKAAEHSRGPDADPDGTASVDERSAERVTTWVRNLVATIDPVPRRIETCLYTNAPGDRIIIEMKGRIVVVSACSGQGFQFSPAIGEDVADLVNDRL